MTADERFDGLRELMRLLTADVALLREDVDHLAAQGARGAGGDPLAGRSGSWTELPPDVADAAWAALTSWVDWLADRYELSESLPVCWYRHGAMVEELHALHLAWHGAYFGRGTQAGGPLLWHEQLDRSMSRLHDWDRHGCASGRHRQSPPLPHDDGQKQARAQRADFIRDDVRARVEPPSPAVE